MARDFRGPCALALWPLLSLYHSNHTILGGHHVIKRAKKPNWSDQTEIHVSHVQSSASASHTDAEPPGRYLVQSESSVTSV